MASVTPAANGSDNGSGNPAAAAAPGDDGTRTANGRFVPPPPPPASPTDRPSQLPHHLATASRFAGRQLLRPRVRVALLGAALIAAAVLWVDGSLGTVLTSVGIVMLVVAWLGSRMQGRFAVEWGESGTRVEFDAGLKPAPEPVRPALNPARAAAPAAPGLAAAPPPPPAPEVIEGEAHTVEIDVTELRRLIAAAEQAEARRAA